MRWLLVFLLVCLPFTLAAVSSEGTLTVEVTDAQAGEMITLTITENGVNNVAPQTEIGGTFAAIMVTTWDGLLSPQDPAIGYPCPNGVVTSNHHLAPDGRYTRTLTLPNQGPATIRVVSVVAKSENNCLEILDETTVTITLLETEPTCSDGLLNGEEENVDCGGSCISCEDSATGTDTQIGVIVSPQGLHVCGDHWGDSLDSLLLQEPLCAVITPGISQTVVDFTCVYKNNIWQWVDRDKPTYALGDANWEYLVSINAIPEDLLEEEALSCSSGSLSPGMIKYSPPPKFKQSICPASSCYAPTGCKDAGFSILPYYTCTLFEDGIAEWTFDALPLAEKMLEEVDDDFLLYCGPSEVAMNNDKTHKKNSFGSCQLATLNGEQVEDVYVGIAWKGNTSGLTYFGEQVALYHEDIDLEENWMEEDFVYIDTEQHFAYFTTRSSLDPTPLERLFTWLTTIFSAERDDVEIHTRSAEQLYILSVDGTVEEYSVEWNLENSCASDRVIVSPNGERCFTESRWRGVIQQR